MTSLQTPEHAVKAFEADLRVPSGFFFSLLDADDWSFVIKLHALVEAALAHLLTEEAGRPALAPIFARQGLAAKLRFARALSLLDEDDRRFLTALSALRNVLAHDVREVHFSLAAHVERLDLNQFKKFRTAFGPGDPVEIGGVTVPEERFVRENPKVVVWEAGLFFIAIAYQRKQLASARKLFADAALRHAHALLTNPFAHTPKE